MRVAKIHLELLGERTVTPVAIMPSELEWMPDEQKTAFRLVIDDALNNGDLTTIDTYMADDYLTHEPSAISPVSSSVMSSPDSAL